MKKWVNFYGAVKQIEILPDGSITDGINGSLIVDMNNGGKTLSYPETELWETKGQALRCLELRFINLIQDLDYVEDFLLDALHIRFPVERAVVIKTYLELEIKRTRKDKESYEKKIKQLREEINNPDQESAMYWR